MMEMLVTLYVPRTAPLAAALEGKAAQGTQRDVRGGLPGTPCAVCREQGCGQKDMHAEARADCAGRPAGNESARGALGRADEGACGMRNGIHAETKASRAERPAGNESARGALGCADEGACSMWNGMYAEARADCAGRPAGHESARGAWGRADEGACSMWNGMHAEARADCAGWPAGNENVRGALGRADERAYGMWNGVHTEARADCAGRPAGNENVRGALGRAEEGADGMRSGVHTEARAGREDKNRSGVWKDACPEQSGEAHGFQSGGGPQAAQGVRPGREENGVRAGQCGACGAQGESRAQAACGEEALPGAGQAAHRAVHGTRGMPLQEKLDAVDEYCTGDSLYTVAASHGIALAAAHRLTASRTLLQENERRRRRLIELVCGARPPVRPVCRGCMWGCRATGLCTQPRCLKEEGPRG